MQPSWTLAHTLGHTVSLSKHCKRVGSFEPQQMTYYALCRSVALSNLKNVLCLQVGLGSHDQVGPRLLNIVSMDGGGSSIHAQQVTIMGQEEIVIQTLDELAQCYGIADVGFVKNGRGGQRTLCLAGSRAHATSIQLPTYLVRV